jgi:hypothetical protein
VTGLRRLRRRLGATAAGVLACAALAKAGGRLGYVWGASSEHPGIGPTAATLDEAFGTTTGVVTGLFVGSLLALVLVRRFDPLTAVASATVGGLLALATAAALGEVTSGGPLVPLTIVVGAAAAGGALVVFAIAAVALGRLRLP